MKESKYNDVELAEVTDIRLKYPMAYEGRRVQYTILKHIYIYNEYIKIKNEVMKKFPEISDYLPQKYYYMILAQRFSMSPNYVCALITKVKRQGNKAFIEAEKAKQKIIEDEYNRTIKRKRKTEIY